MTALIVLEAVVILLLGLLVAGLLRSHAEILRRLHDLGVHMGGENDHIDRGFDVHPRIEPPGSISPLAHDVSGSGPGGEAVAVRVLGGVRPTLLAFLSSGCTTCAEFWTAFADPAVLDRLGGVRLVIVTKDAADESVTAVAEAAPPRVSLVMSSRAWSDYGVPGSPYFVLADGNRGLVVGEGSAGTWEQLRRLMDEALDDRGRAARPSSSGPDRADRIDRELMASGIHPGHHSLYENPDSETSVR